MATPTTLTPRADELPSPALKRNFGWCLVGNYVYAACQAAIVVVVAKLGTPGMMGQFALGLAIATPLLMLLNMQLRTVEASDARRDWAFSDCLGLRIVTSSLALAFVTAILPVFRFQRETAIVVLLVTVSKCLESVSDVCYGLFQRAEQLQYVSFSMMIRGFLSLAAMAAGLALGWRMAGAVVLLAVAWLLVVLAYDLPVAARLTGARRLRPRFHPRTMAALTRLAYPLGISMMLLALNQSVPRYFVESYRGESAVGLFAALAYMSVAPVTVLDAMGNAAVPRLSRYFESSQSGAFWRLCGGLLTLGGFVGSVSLLVSILWGGRILALLYSSVYADHQKLLIYVMLGALLTCLASAITYSMAAAHAFRPQAGLLVSVVLVCIAACTVLVPRYGLEGGALAAAIAAGAHLVGAAALLWRASRPLQRAAGQTASPPPPSHAYLREDEVWP